MKITEVRLRRVLNGARLKAVATITIDDVFVVHDIKVIQGDNGDFIAMPSRKTPDGIYRDIAHPIDSHLREILQEAILEEFAKQVNSDFEMEVEEETRTDSVKAVV